MVGWTPHSDDEDLPAADLPCPDPEDLLDPTDPLPAVLLLAADPRQLPGHQVDAGLSAWFAHTNQTTLAQARWILETSRAQPDTRDRVTDRRRPGKIIAATLGWSDGYATSRLEFAHHILERLPALGAAMAAGVLEEHKAWIFTSTLADLDTTQARTVVDQVLPAAPTLAFQTLRLRIEKAAQAVDPDWAAARRAAAIARRRVAFRVAPSGAAELCGLDLPEEPAQDAHDRIVALARHIARRLRRAGLDAPTGPIQSEVMLTLTGPAGAGMWDTDVIDHVVSRFGGPTDDDGPDDEGPHDGPDDGGPDDGPDDGGGGTENVGPEGPDGPPGDGGAGDGPLDTGQADEGTASDADGEPGGDGPNEKGPANNGPTDGIAPPNGSPGNDGSDAGAPIADSPDDVGQHAAPGRATEDGREDATLGDASEGLPDGEPGGCPDRHDDASGSGRIGVPDGAAKAPWRVAFVPRVALRVGLATVLGLDRRPGQLPARGPVTTAVAVSMAWARTASTFRLLLYRPDGHLEHALTLRPPRTGPPAPFAAQRRHHIVELTAYSHELDALAAALPGGQTTLAIPDPPGVLRVPPGATLVPGDALGLLDRAARAPAAARARPIAEHPAHSTAEEANRFPSAALRAWVQARDQTCRSPGCAADAATCDVDHTCAVTDGGVTRADELGPFCRRDHTFKHDPDTGWTVRQTHPGRFVWTAPTGRVHTKEPEPYDPLPDPVPRTDRDEPPLSATCLGEPPTPAPGSPRRNRHGFLTRAAQDTAERLRERARNRRGTPEPTPDTETDQTAEDRFPEEPPF